MLGTWQGYLAISRIRAAKPAGKPYKLFDERGLFLLVTPAGGRLRRLRYRLGGVEKLLTNARRISRRFAETGAREARRRSQARCRRDRSKRQAPGRAQRWRQHLRASSSNARCSEVRIGSTRSRPPFVPCVTLRYVPLSARWGRSCIASRARRPKASCNWRCTATRSSFWRTCSIFASTSMPCPDQVLSW
jgi:hypothetical protein